MTTLFLPLDRHAALVRSLWRLLGAILIGGRAASIAARIDWAEYGRNQRIVGASLAFILACVAIPGLLLAVSGVRWLIAGLSAGNGVELNDRALVIRGSPFGNQSFDRPRLRLQLNGDLSPEAWAMMPEDAIGIGLTHPEYYGDLFERIRSLLGARTNAFVKSLQQEFTAGTLMAG